MADRRLRCTVSCTMDDRQARRPHLPQCARGARLCRSSAGYDGSVGF